MPSIQASSKNIHSLFSETDLFKVPSFQRSFSWQKKQVRQLADDLLDAFNEDKTEDYFLGNLIFVNQNNESEIIDGQHRVTSLFLITMAISAMTATESLIAELSRIIKTPNGNLKLTLADRHQNFLVKLASSPSPNEFLQQVEKQELNTTELNFYEALEEIIKSLGKLIAVSAVDDFANWFLHNCLVVVTELSQRSKAFKIFTVVNTTGIRLDEVDYIRSILIGDDDRQFKKHCPAWDDIYENGNSRNSLSLALSAYNHAVHGYRKNDYSKCFWNRSSILYDEKAIELNALNSYLERYKAHFILGNLPEGLTNSDMRNGAAYFRTLCSLKHYEWQGLFLRMLVTDPHFKNTVKWNKFLFNLERAVVIFAILGKQSGTRGRSYQTAWEGIENNFDEIEIDLQESVSRTWGDVEKKIKNEAYGSSWCAALLMKLNHIYDENVVQLH